MRIELLSCLLLVVGSTGAQGSELRLTSMLGEASDQPIAFRRRLNLLLLRGSWIVWLLLLEASVTLGESIVGILCSRLGNTTLSFRSLILLVLRTGRGQRDLTEGVMEPLIAVLLLRVVCLCLGLSLRLG